MRYMVYLDQDDFHALVAGGEVVKGNLHVVLVEINFARMEAAIASAHVAALEAMPPGKSGKRRMGG